MVTSALLLAPFSDLYPSRAGLVVLMRIKALAFYTPQHPRANFHVDVCHCPR